MRLAIELGQPPAYIWRRFRVVNGARYESSFTRGRKERKKHGILNIRVGKRSTRGTRHSGGGETVKRNESAMMCRTSRTNGHSYVRREIFIGEKERERTRERKGDTQRGKEGRPDEDYVICIWEISFTTLRFLLPDSIPTRSRCGVRTVAWARDVNHCSSE